MSRRRPARLALVGPVLAMLTSVGPADAEAPYRVRHYDLRSLPVTQLSFSGWHRLPIPPEAPVDEDGLPLVPNAGVLSYAVGEMSMNGMYRLADWTARCDGAQLAQALAQAAKLRELALTRRGAWCDPHEFDYPPYAQRAPWFNAMTQGLALSFFVRLYQVTGDPVHLDAADRIFASFERLGRRQRPWTAYVDGDRHLWLEHYPNDRPDHILNAHLHALFGLYEYWNATGSPEARQVLEGAITTMDDAAWQYRRKGAASLYGLGVRSAHAKYHRIHVWQMRLLASISGEQRFSLLADRLERDLPGPGTWRGTPSFPPLPLVRPCAS